MKTIFTNFILLDGSRYMRPLKNKRVVIENGKIIDICENDEKFIDGKVVDLGGRYLLPGLINLHVHLPASGKYKKKQADNKKLVKLVLSNPIMKKIGIKLCLNNAKTELYSGVTTIRTVGGIGDIDTIVRDKINSGKTIGPRVLASNTAICSPDGHMEGTVAKTARSEQECKSLVYDLKKQNADLVKLMITGGVLDAKVKGEPGVLKMPPNYVKTCVEEAHKYGLKVAAHIESPEGVLVALQNGVDTIEHGSKLTDEMIDLFIKNKSALICTLSPALPLAKFDKNITNASDMVVYNSNVVLDGVIQGTTTCLEKNIPVGIGTDTGCPFITHYNMWRELHYFTKQIKALPEYALYTATLGNAKIAGIDDVTGSIEVGKQADMIVCDSNPLDDFRTLSKLYMVIKDGKIIKQPKIKKYKFNDELLDKYM